MNFFRSTLLKPGWFACSYGLIVNGMLPKLICILVLAFYSQCYVLAQDIQSGTTPVYPALKARKYKIIHFGNQKSIARSLDSLIGNNLYISGKKGTRQIHLETIKELHVAKKGRPVGRGIIFGTFSGAAAGALIGLATYQEPDPDDWMDFGPGFSAMAGSVMGGLGGIITGTVVGAASNRYIHHDFLTMSPSEKHDLMRRILLAQ